MTANVSDQPSSGGNANGSNNDSSMAPPSQLSPPRPISTLQHNYSNIQQPAPVLPLASAVPTPPLGVQRPAGPSSLPSTQGSNGNSTAGSPFTAGLPGSTGGLAGSGSGGSQLTLPGGSGDGNGAFSRSAVRPRTPPEERGARQRERTVADEVLRNRLSEIQDLIHLEAPITEDSIMRTLQARFFNQKYFVSHLPILIPVLRSGFHRLSLWKITPFHSSTQEFAVGSLCSQYGIQEVENTHA